MRTRSSRDLALDAEVVAGHSPGLFHVLLQDNKAQDAATCVVAKPSARREPAQQDFGRQRLLHELDAGVETPWCPSLSSVYPDMYSTRVSGRVSRNRAASCGPLIFGMITSVSSRWSSPAVAHQRSACSPSAASITS